VTDTSTTDALMATASTWALIVLAALCLVRVPAAWSHAEARPTWFATFCGAGALLTLGFAVPLPVVDSWVGGNNNAMLAEGILATGAFWFMFCELANMTGRHIRRLAHLVPLTLIAVFTLLFFMITDRAGSSRDFILERIGQTASWAAISVYFAGLASISLASFRIVLKMTGRRYGLFRLGYTATMTAAAANISFMTLEHFSIGTEAARAPFWNSYVAFFYGGILLLAAGFITVYVWEKLRWKYYLYRLQPIHLRMKNDAQKEAATANGPVEPRVPKENWELRPLLSVLRERKPMFVVYELALAIRHMELYNRAKLSDTEREFVRHVDEALDELLDDDSIPIFTETFETSAPTNEVL
jgi:hypothetical protein